MDKTWPLQNAKSRFLEVVERAEKGEAQVITKHGEKAVVVDDDHRYLHLTGQARSLLEVLRGDPPTLFRRVGERARPEPRSRRHLRVSYLQSINVVSKARRPRPDEHVLNGLATQPLTSTYLSVITLGELEEGIAALGDTGRAQTLKDWLAHLTESFGGRILDVDRDVATTWGRIRADAKRQGRPPPLPCSRPPQSPMN